MNQRDIHRIGEGLCQCHEVCAGIKRNQRKGDFPRGIIFEDGDDTGFGTMICGLNPGTAKQDEKDFVVKNGGNYEALLKFWDKKIKKIRYFDRPRRFVRGLGRTGPIFWTDVVKCKKNPRKLDWTSVVTPQLSDAAHQNFY